MSPYPVNKPIEGKYAIQQKLKVGGFGSVYTVRELKDASRVYAVKLMPMSAQKYADIELRLYELLQKHKVTTGFVKVQMKAYSSTITEFLWTINTS